jgi:hypothetical protein
MSDPLCVAVLCTLVTRHEEPARPGISGTRENATFFDPATETNVSLNLTALVDHGRLQQGKRYKVTFEEVA